MRDLLYQLNLPGIKVDISTFFKASKQRIPAVFEQLFKTLVKSLKSQAGSDKIALFSLDLTTITLTSKLL